MSVEPVDAGIRSVKSAVHTIEVLEFLARRQNEPARLREIGEATGIPRSSLYALMRTLTDRGWVRRDPSGALYSVGAAALMVGMSYIDSDLQLQMAQPWLARLNERIDETVHLGRLDGTDIVYLATRESSKYLRAINRVGRRLPASATSLGKAILAELPDSRVDAHLLTPLPSLTANTLTDRAQLQDDLHATKLRGYSIDNEENTIGLRCFGFAIRNSHTVTDAISCSVPISTLTPEREALIVATMSETVAELERMAPNQSALRGH